MLRQKGKRLSISSRLRLFLNILNSSMKSLLLITTLVIISGLFARAANAEQEKAFLNLKPTKKLVIVIEKKDENGSSTNTTENFIAEKDGKFVIPVPGPCK